MHGSVFRLRGPMNISPKQPKITVFLLPTARIFPCFPLLQKTLSDWLSEELKKGKI